MIATRSFAPLELGAGQVALRNTDTESAVADGKSLSGIDAP